MSLAKKYNIPEDTVKKMIRDGAISCSVRDHYDIFEAYQQFRNSNPEMAKESIFVQLSEDLKVSYSTVKQVVYKLSKI